MNIICFGDSNTYGYENQTYFGGRYNADSRWVDLLAAQTGWNILNEGLNGREIPQRAISVPDNTDLLIVMLGTNDLLQGATAASATKRMESFLNGISIDKEKLLLIAPPPMEFGVWVPEEYLISESLLLTKKYKSLAESMGIHFADAGEWNVSLVFDGIHFSKEGHRSFAANLYHYLKQELSLF